MLIRSLQPEVTIAKASLSSLCALSLGAVLLVRPAAAQTRTVRIFQTIAAGDYVHIIDPASNRVVDIIEGIPIAHGVTSQSVKPTMVQLGVPPESLVSGDAKTSFIPALAGSGRRQSYQWIVRGKAGQTITIKAAAEKGGSATRTVTLQ